MLQALFTHLTALVVLSSQGTNLGPGSSAPKLDIKTWVKGQRVGSLDKDKTYVIEFWATWCGPCLESIPHLTKLAKDHRDVSFIGVSVWEDNDKRQVQDFVEKMGGKMDYTVGYSGNKTGMAATWLAPAKQPGIPTAFIVKNNIIMWIGHPLNLEKPLTQLTKNEFDIVATRKKFDEAVAARETAQKIQDNLDLCEKLYDSGDVKAAKAKLEEIEKDPQGKSAATDIRFKWLAIEDPAAWRKAALEQMNGSNGARANLSIFASSNVGKVPEQCKWLIAELTSGRYAPDWYPWLCGARMYLQLKEYDKALEYAGRSRDVILEYRRANPNVPKGNALDVIAALEDQIKKQKLGGTKR